MYALLKYVLGVKSRSELRTRIVPVVKSRFALLTGSSHRAGHGLTVVNESKNSSRTSTRILKNVCRLGRRQCVDSKWKEGEDEKPRRRPQQRATSARDCGCCGFRPYHHTLTANSPLSSQTIPDILSVLYHHLLDLVLQTLCNE